MKAGQAEQSGERTHYALRAKRCQGYYDVTLETKVKTAQLKALMIVSEKRFTHCQRKGSITHNNCRSDAKTVIALLSEGQNEE